MHGYELGRVRRCHARVQHDDGHVRRVHVGRELLRLAAGVRR